ncbi:hypothetical protein TBLA_0B02790 [Henningerozyma blattae CBS 6284]|uniref:Uncharacterized protein n=1 Tax=Henningerozyma blattae (strain ATCC 34711 / CBS 6284 / DSM 70876 / NBRC 10599 / NRRL Y-10934 / UCD 77-7) TaxID=1071380 RepID=I2GYB9_HENB6|nr:hypothetical protein TBLA_0B02790 [Tetrapisispora blattae CBS 6284]CCH59121.1 hypothetical protein TBLA_0B02790 [Tetrapisispora blattae CBS 6284]
MNTLDVEPSLISTPRSKTIVDIVLPRTPNKKIRKTTPLSFTINNAETDTIISKNITTPAVTAAFKLSRKHKIRKFKKNNQSQYINNKLNDSKIPNLVSPSPIIKTSSKNIQPQFLTLNTTTYENVNYNENTPTEDDELLSYSPSRIRNIYDSDYTNRIFSPIYGDEVSSSTSTTPTSNISSNDIISPFSPNINLNPWNINGNDEINEDHFNYIPENNIFDSLPSNTACNNKPLLNDVTQELNRIIRSSLFNKFDNNLSSVADQKLTNSSLISSSENNNMHKPCHRYKTPKNPILKIHPNSLNFLVSSSKKSLEDATIFATEINMLLSKDCLKIPKIISPLEKVSIPVNSSVKKNIKNKREI